MKRSMWRAIGGALSFHMLAIGAQAGSLPGILDGLPRTMVLAAPSIAPPSRPSQTLNEALRRISAQREFSAFGFPCATQFKTRSLPDAMIAVDVHAPCRPGESVRIVQDTIRFDLTMPATGELSFTVPAMSEEVELKAIFESGETFHATTSHQDISAFIRVLLQSDEPDRMNLHADAPRTIPVKRHRLGDGTGATVDLLSHHLDPEGVRGVIRLSLVSTVGRDSCGTESTGVVAELPVEGPPRQYAIRLSNPGCDRVGETLELKNVVQDLKLSRN